VYLILTPLPPLPPLPSADGRVSQSTITRAEGQLTAYNDDWANRLASERANWAEVLKEKDAEKERALVKLQTQFNEAHSFYHHQVERLKGEVIEEERQRRDIEGLLDELKLDLNREKSARKALTKQLKKERKWRERCLDLTKDVMDLRTEGGQDEELRNQHQMHIHQQIQETDAVASGQTSNKSSVDNYISSVSELLRSSNGGSTPSPAPPLNIGQLIDSDDDVYNGDEPLYNRLPRAQTPPLTTALKENKRAAATTLLHEERRKNKLLSMELLRQRQILINTTHPGSYPHTVNQPYLGTSIAVGSTVNPQERINTLGSSTTAGGPLDREVAALRIAVEQADIEHTLETELQIEKDVEIQTLRDQINDEREGFKSSQAKLESLQKDYEKLKVESIEKEDKRRSAISEILQSSEMMHKALQEEKERHGSEEEQLTDMYENKIGELERKHEIEMDKMNQRFHIEQGQKEEIEKEKWRRARLNSIMNDEKLIEMSKSGEGEEEGGGGGEGGGEKKVLQQIKCPSRTESD